MVCIGDAVMTGKKLNKAQRLRGYKMEGAPDAVADDRKLLDVTALAEGYASITPLAVDNTRLDMMTPLAEAGFGIRRRAEMSSGRTLKSSSEVSAGSAAE